jgi:hypothetical protein
MFLKAVNTVFPVFSFPHYFVEIMHKAKRLRVKSGQIFIGPPCFYKNQELVPLFFTA